MGRLVNIPLFLETVTESRREYEGSELKNTIDEAIVKAKKSVDFRRIQPYELGKAIAQEIDKAIGEVEGKTADLILSIIVTEMVSLPVVQQRVSAMNMLKQREITIKKGKGGKKNAKQTKGRESESNQAGTEKPGSQE